MSVPARPLILGAGDTVIGLILLTGSATRTSSRAYTQIKQVTDTHTWGLILLAIGVTLLAAAVGHQHLPPHRAQAPSRLFALAGATWTTYWAVVLVQTAHADPHVSYTGSALWFFFGTIPHLVLALGKEG